MTVITGDCLDVMRGMPDASVDSVVTDPPYGLSSSKGDPYSVFDVFCDVGLPDLAKMNSEAIESGNLSSIPDGSSSLAGVDRSIRKDPGIGMPKRSVDLQCGTIGEHEIRKSTETTGDRVANRSLSIEPYPDTGQFLGDYILDLGDIPHTGRSDLGRRYMPELFSGGFAVPVCAVFPSGLPNLVGDSTSIEFGNERVRLGNNTLCKTNGPTGVVTFPRTINSLMLRFNLTGCPVEIVATNRADELSTVGQDGGPQLVRAFPAACGLSSVAQPHRVSVICDGADGTISQHYFNLWMPSDRVMRLKVPKGGFMGKAWDATLPDPAVWREVFRVLKPGGHLLAFAGTRTQHRMAAAIEDAGFEIRDMIAWVYGSGFPKSHDVSKAIDKLDAAAARTERQLRFTEWMRSTGLTSRRIDELTGTNMGGHYTTAKSQPAVATRDHFETLRPYIAAPVPQWVEDMVDQRTVESENFKRREIVESKEMRDTSSVRIAVTQHADSYDATATRTVDITTAHTPEAQRWQGWGTALKPSLEPITVARKPLAGTVAANVLEHGTGAINIDGCRVGFADDADRTVTGRHPANLIHDGSDIGIGDAQRFFYQAKASKADRNDGLDHVEPRATAASEFRPNHAAKAADGQSGNPYGRWTPTANNHPTVKPTDLMRYLCRLVTPPGGLVLDPFTGSGSTGRGAVLEGFRFIGIERDPDYAEIARARISAVSPRPVMPRPGNTPTARPVMPRPA